MSTLIKLVNSNQSTEWYNVFNDAVIFKPYAKVSIVSIIVENLNESYYFDSSNNLITFNAGYLDAIPTQIMTLRIPSGSYDKNSIIPALNKAFNSKLRNTVSYFANLDLDAYCGLEFLFGKVDNKFIACGMERPDNANGYEVNPIVKNMPYYSPDPAEMIMGNTAQAVGDPAVDPGVTISAGVSANSYVLLKHSLCDAVYSMSFNLNNLDGNNEFIFGVLDFENYTAVSSGKPLTTDLFYLRIYVSSYLPGANSRIVSCFKENVLANTFTITDTALNQFRYIQYSTIPGANPDDNARGCVYAVFDDYTTTLGNPAMCYISDSFVTSYNDIYFPAVFFSAPAYTAYNMKYYKSPNSVVNESGDIVRLLTPRKQETYINIDNIKTTPRANFYIQFSKYNPMGFDYSPYIYYNVTGVNIVASRTPLYQGCGMFDVLLNYIPLASYDSLKSGFSPLLCTVLFNATTVDRYVSYEPKYKTSVIINNSDKELKVNKFNISILDTLLGIKINNFGNIILSLLVE